MDSRFDLLNMILNTPPRDHLAHVEVEVIDALAQAAQVRAQLSDFEHYSFPSTTERVVYHNTVGLRVVDILGEPYSWHFNLPSLRPLDDDCVQHILGLARPGLTSLRTHLGDIQTACAERGYYVKSAELREVLNAANMLSLWDRRQAENELRTRVEERTREKIKNEISRDPFELARSLPGDAVGRLKEGIKECPVCLKAHGDYTVFTPCGHFACFECYMFWARSSSNRFLAGEFSCPHCRAECRQYEVTNYKAFEAMHMRDHRHRG